MLIDISKLDKADVLVALYNDARPLGFGFMHYTPQPLSRDEAVALLADTDAGTYFDYLNGRVMKSEIGKDTYDPRLYDRDNGEGAAARALAKIKEQP